MVSGILLIIYAYNYNSSNLQSNGQVRLAPGSHLAGRWDLNPAEDQTGWPRLGDSALAGLNTGPAKPMTLKLILVTL